MSHETVSPYYKDSGRVPFASSLSYAVRKRIFHFFMDVMQPSHETTLLDIGVTSDVSFQESNFFESFYPYKDRIVCVGTENGARLESAYPGIRFMQVESGQRLPFSDKQFDIVFSNAVVEHAGGFQSQRAFISEACRVGQRVFIVTPNRWFPVEHHTGVPLLHHLPKAVYRRILRWTPLEYWSYEQNLNLLTRHEFVTLFPDDYPIRVEYLGVGFGPFQSNLVAYTTSA